MPPAAAFVDLHVPHVGRRFDSLASPAAVVRAAAGAGLTHLAITDHDRIDGALEARDAGGRSGPDGDRRRGDQDRRRRPDLRCSSSGPSRPGSPRATTIAAVRAQGGLVGIPHPFDRFRGSLLRDPG